MRAATLDAARAGSSPVVVASYVLDAEGDLPKGSLVLAGSGSSLPDAPAGHTVDVAYTPATAAPAGGLGAVGEKQLRRNPPAFAALLGAVSAAGPGPVRR